MQMVTEVGVENNSTTVMMIPADFVHLADNLSSFLKERTVWISSLRFVRGRHSRQRGGEEARTAADGLFDSHTGSSTGTIKDSLHQAEPAALPRYETACSLKWDSA
jgi:hypothetical protein